MSKTDSPKPSETPKLIRKRPYTFPDIVGGGPAVVVEATSLEEAIELYKKGQASA